MSRVHGALHGGDAARSLPPSRPSKQPNTRWFVDLQRTYASPQRPGPPHGANLQHRDDIDLHVHRPVPNDSRGRQIQKPAPRGQPSPVDRVLREAGVFVKMNEGSRKLDQPLVKTPVFINATQPQNLQNIMRLIVLAAVEQFEKRSVFPG